MQSFLSEVAGSLYERYGDDLSSLQLVVPSRRARLFFADSLSRIALRPLWQPRFVGINELMEQIAGVRACDRIRLVVELYRIYSQYHQEGFDDFYFWGEMLLSDFDQIDKYRVDADMLFTNISDLHALENHDAYLNKEQREAIARFWRNFTSQQGGSDEKRRFLSVWNTLRVIYHQYREQLLAQGLAYEGMVHRMAAEKIRTGDLPADFAPQTTRYAVVGFNALSECEKILFDWLARSTRAEFWWDYDHYYTDNPDHEAGLFLRSNIRAFPAQGEVSSDLFSRPKELTAVSAPSDSLQCKYVHTFLSELLNRGIRPDKETAIVLTDESLLLPVLYSIPEQITQVNVTMGYPLRQTTAYSFVERLIELQRRVRTNKRGGGAVFYHSDVIGMLNHPYVLMCQGERSRRLIEEIRREQRVWITAGRLGGEGIMDEIFTPVKDWESLSAYLQRILGRVEEETTRCALGAEGQHASADLQGDLFQNKRNVSSQETPARRREFFSTLIEELCRIENSLRDCALPAVSLGVYCSLLRKMIQGIRIPYQGEPLAGVQIMGILETRNLDFENLLVLSVNDDTFPGNMAVTPSFVPHNLRLAYGLPTPQHHEGVYAYYFYRLLQRAKVVHLAYCSRSDERHTGEPSRYIYQLDYESPHVLQKRSIPLSVNLSETIPLSIEKSGAVAAKLRAYLDGGGATFSPTSFYTYVECPLKFYFGSVERLREETQVAEEIDLPMFGTILHKAMELLYLPLLKIAHPSVKIAKLIGNRAVDEAVRRAVSGEYLHDEGLPVEEYGGNVLLIYDIVRRYVNTCILPYDVAHPGFTLLELEQEVRADYSFTLRGDLHKVTFRGKSDRIDLLDSGLLRVVDYKTGKEHAVFKSVEELFGERAAQRSSAVLQTLLYSLILSRSRGCDIQPTLYYVRQMNRPDFSPLLVEGKSPVLSFAPYEQVLEENLQHHLATLFDERIPFTQCTDTTTCDYCDFREICRR